jgi:hypothetical protein
MNAMVCGAFYCWRNRQSERLPFLFVPETWLTWLSSPNKWHPFFKLKEKETVEQIFFEF